MPKAVQVRGIHGAIGDVKDARKPVLPTLVGHGHILPRVRFNSSYTWNVRGEAGGLNQRGPRTREVLHAQEHFIFLHHRSQDHHVLCPLQALSAAPVYPISRESIRAWRSVRDSSMTTGFSFAASNITFCR